MLKNNLQRIDLGSGKISPKPGSFKVGIKNTGLW